MNRTAHLGDIADAISCSISALSCGASLAIDRSQLSMRVPRSASLLHSSITSPSTTLSATVPFSGVDMSSAFRVVVVRHTIAGRGRAASPAPDGSLSLSATSPAGTCAPRPIFRSHRGFVVQGRGAHAASSTPFPFGGWPLLPAGNADRAVAYPPRRSSTAARSAPYSSLANPLAHPLASQPGGERRRRATPRPSPAFPSCRTGSNRRMRRSACTSGAAR